MVKVAPNLYRKYITVDKKGAAILYVKMQKSMYSLLRSALLFYKMLVGELESSGFKLNPYGPYGRAGDGVSPCQSTTVVSMHPSVA
jgi:hypothetical protein